MHITAQHRRAFIKFMSWLVALAVSLQPFGVVRAQTTTPEAPAAEVITNTAGVTSTIDSTPQISVTAPMTISPDVTSSWPITLAPMMSVTLPAMPVLENAPAFTQPVTVIVTDTGYISATVRQGDVVAKMEPPKEHGRQEAVNVREVNGDIVHPPKRTVDAAPASQPVYVILDWGKIRTGKSTQVKLDLQVITPTASPIDISITLPAGLSYDGKGSKQISYDAGARVLTWRNIDTRAKMLLNDSFRIDVNVPAAPVLLQTVVDWRTTDGTQWNATTYPLNIGALNASKPLSRKEGGEFQATKRVKLTFPPGSLKANMAVSSAEYVVVTQSVAAGDSVYSVNVLPVEFGPDMQFDAPVTVTVDASGLFPADVLSATGRMPVLQYVYSEVITPAMRNDGTPITTTVLRIEDIPSYYDSSTGLLTAQITHFSTYQASLQQPVNPQLWKLTANAANVSLFRGALNYAYPIQTPGMVDGLQPNLSLNYSSAAADGGFDQQYQPGENLSMGIGWSLEVPKITRSIRRGYFCDGGESWNPRTCYGRVSYSAEYANDFTLSLGGKTYNLIAKGYGEYVPEDYAPIRARLCNDVNPCAGDLSIPGTNANGTFAGNTTGEYWQVWTPDGTRWLFGIDNQTENRVYAFSYDWGGHYELPYNPSWNQYAGYAGRAEGTIVRAWFLRRAYAPNRDEVWAGRWSVQWLYESGSNTVTSQFSNSSLSQPDDWARPIKVVYGPSIKPDGSAASQRWLAQFEYGWGARLTNLYVGMGDANGNAWRWLRRYELGTANGQTLDGVLEYAINAPGYWQTGLPRSSFYYVVLPHNNNMAPPLLNHIENGYGATWDYEYAGDPVWNSYWVTKAWTRSWVNGAVTWTGLTTYDYSPNRCTATAANANICVNPAHVINGSYPNNLVGFEWVNESVANPANPAQKLSQTYHYFVYNNLHKLGREWQTRTFDGNGAPLAAQTTEFYDWPDATGGHGLPGGAWFVATRAINTFPLGDVNSSPYKRVVYDYDDNFNNGWAGRPLVGANLTRKVDWGFVCGGSTCDGDEVTTRYGYYPNTTSNKWIVNKLAWENIYAGADEWYEWPANFRAQSLLYYDGSGSFSAPPVRGQLTQVLAGNSGIATERTTQQIGYDAVGNITAITDGRGYVTNAGYDANGWFMMWAQTPANDASTRLMTQYRYYGVDESGCAGGAGTFAGFGPYGALKCSIDPNGVATASYSYDLFGRLRKLVKPGDTFAQPTEEYFYYNPNTNGMNPNNPFMVQRFVRKSSNYGMNPWGGDSGGWWTPSQSADLNALGAWDRTFYDGLGRVIETQTPMADWAYGGQMAITWTSYDAFGRAWQQSVPYAEAWSGTWYRNPNGNAVRTTTAYDALGRVTSVTGPDGAVTQHYWVADSQSGAGYAPTYNQVHSIVDANGHAKHEVTNGLGRLIRVREFTGANPWAFYAETKYAYDTLGNLIGVTDAQGNVTSITYDALSRKKSMADPDMGSWAYDYDANGNLTWQRDAKGQVMTFRYDALNRMTDKYVNGAWTSWNRYDETWATGNALGRRTRSGLGINIGSNWSNEVYYNYDSRGQITREHRSIDGAGWFDTNYTYDAADRVTSMTYPNGEVVNTNYNDAMEPASLSGWSSYVSGATYNALGKPATIDLPNGLRTRFTYMGVDIVNPAGYGNANWGRLRQICVLPQSAGSSCYDWSFNGAGSTNTRMNIGYWYDAGGNVTYFDEYDKGYYTAFGYDALGRLTSASGATNESYSYDAIGNLKSKTGVGNYDYKTSPGWGCSAGPHAIIRTSITGYCYDANGNVVWRWAEAPFIYGYEWNADNKITQVKKLSADGAYTNLGTLAEFAYDADGNRVKKVEGSGATYTEGFNTLNPAKWQFDNTLQSIVDEGNGNKVVRMVGPNIYSWPGIHRTSNTLRTGQSMGVDFKLSQINTVLHLMLHSNDGDARWAVVESGGNIFAHYIINSQNTGWGIGGTLIANAVPGRWYRATLSVNDSAGFTARVCERDNANVCGTWSRAMPADKLWRFDSTSYAGVADLDNYTERNDVAMTTVYVGSHYELNLSTATATSYYYFNGQRVALRVRNMNTGVMQVLWLHGDLLGSASLLTNAGGGVARGRFTGLPLREKQR